jgi:hypothetical protein
VAEQYSSAKFRRANDLISIDYRNAALHAYYRGWSQGIQEAIEALMKMGRPEAVQVAIDYQKGFAAFRKTLRPVRYQQVQRILRTTVLFQLGRTDAIAAVTKAVTDE